MELRSRSFVGIVAVAGATLFACASARAPAELPTEPDSNATATGGEDEEYPEDLAEQPGEETDPVGESEAPSDPVDPVDPDAQADGGAGGNGDASVPPQGTKIVQRYSCVTEPTAGATFCKNKGFARGSITRSGACFRVEDFNVKDIEYTCFK